MFMNLSRIAFTFLSLIGTTGMVSAGTSYRSLSCLLFFLTIVLARHAKSHNKENMVPEDGYDFYREACGAWKGVPAKGIYFVFRHPVTRQEVWIKDLKCAGGTTCRQHGRREARCEDIRNPRKPYFQRRPA